MGRIALRHYRLFTRAPYLDVGGGEISARLPAYFGRDRRWTIPVRDAAVVDPDSRVTGPQDQVLLAVPVMPYLVTTNRNVAANLLILFTRPTRIPPVSRLGSLTSLPYRKSRSEWGYLVDGIRLRVVDPRDAFAQLTSAGVEAAEGAFPWLLAHRESTKDPSIVKGVVTTARRSSRVLAVAGAWLLACLIAAQVLRATGHLGFAFIPLVAMVPALLMSIAAGRASRRPITDPAAPQQDSP